MDRTLCGNLNVAALALEFPSSQTVPVATVCSRVFEVAVLYKFAVKTTVSTKTDVLEEDSDKFLADVLTLAAFHCERSLHWLEVGKAYGILSHVFVKLYLTVGKEVVTLDEFVNLRPLHTVDLTCHFASVESDLHFLTLFLATDGSTLVPFLEVGRSGAVCLAVISGVFHNPLAIVLVEYRQLTASACNVWIVLRFPVDEVRACAVSKLRVVLVWRPHTTPHAFAVAQKEWSCHLLLSAPCSEVAVNECPSITDGSPTLVVRTIRKGKTSAINV